MATNNAINSPQPFGVGIGGTGLANPTAHGILIGQGSSPLNPIVLSAGHLLIGTTSGDPSAAALTAGTGISITSSSGSVTITATGSAVGWTTVTGATQAMTTNNAYIANDTGAVVVFTLPTTSAVGDLLIVVGKATGMGWQITYTTGQNIQLGNVASTATTGNIASSAATDCITLRCIVANTTWQATDAWSSGISYV